MKNKKITAATRSKLLISIIRKRFGKKPYIDFEVASQDYDEAIFEMFYVSEVYSSHVELVHFFNEAIYSPVKMDESLLSLLKPRDLFLMQLGFKSKENQWHVIDMSPPYN